MGLRYPQNLITQLLQGVYGMKESVSYQAIVEEGLVKGTQDVLLRQGHKKFGVPDEHTENALRSITDLDRLNYLSERLLDVSTWADLLALP
jgi:hypothetical protein